MSFYSVLPWAVSTPGDGGSGAACGGGETTRMVAVPVSALAWPVRVGSGGDGRSALVVAGAEPITAGDLVAWCTVVVVAPALRRRDGRVQAAGLWVPESRRTSCDLLILVVEPAEAVVSFDLVDLGCCGTGEWS